MELSDIVKALEDLKNGIESVRSANANVERAATAARKVCKAFGECSSQLQSFRESVLDPIKCNVGEISAATSIMVEKSGENVKEFRDSANSISGDFRSIVDKSCKLIEADLAKFQEQLVGYDNKCQILCDCVKERTDVILDEVRSLGGETQGGLLGLQAAQAESAGQIEKAIGDASTTLGSRIDSSMQGLNLSFDNGCTSIRDIVNSTTGDVLTELRSAKRALDSSSQELNSTIERESSALTGYVKAAKDDVLSEVHSATKAMESAAAEMVANATRESSAVSSNMVAAKDAVIAEVRSARKAVIIAIATVSALLFCTFAIVAGALAK